MRRDEGNVDVLFATNSTQVVFFAHTFPSQSYFMYHEYWQI
jgi:hypothetical protein